MLLAHNISKRFGSRLILDELSLELEMGKIYALIGPNGSGKTTLLNILSGFLQPESGYMSINGISSIGLPPEKINMLGVGRSFQDLRLITDLTVLENVLLSFRGQEGEKWWKALISSKLYSDQEMLLTQNAISILERTFLQDLTNSPAGQLSYGQQKLLTLACSIANDSDFLLFDEPVAGVTQEYRRKLETVLNELKKQGKSILLIEHHRNFIENTCDKIFFLWKGGLIEFDNYYEMARSPEVIKSYM